MAPPPRDLLWHEQHPFLIAEAGVNHNGSTETALRLVDAARRAGADAVKFQVFSASRLVAAGAPTAKYQQKSAADQRSLLADLELKRDDFQQIADHCGAVGIQFLATPFDPVDLEFLLTLDVPAVKIASTDLNNRPLLSASFATGLPTLLSTGAALTREIDRSVAWYRRAECAGPLLLLHCVSSYPTPPDRANLRAIDTLKLRYALPVGYSDHTTSITAGALAMAAGASVIEKHFTLDRSLPGPDHAMSLEPVALTEYIALIRESQSLMGSGALDCDDVERDVREVARRSVVADRDLAAGDVLVPAMLTVKRPGGGIDPAFFEEVLGWQVAADIPRETPITWEMLRPRPAEDNTSDPHTTATRDSTGKQNPVPSGPAATK
jgi:sialic acid synthase SpsE